MLNANNRSTKIAGSGMTMTKTMLTASAGMIQSLPLPMIDFKKALLCCCHNSVVPSRPRFTGRERHPVFLP